MAGLPSKAPNPKGFVDIITSMSVAGIVKEASRPISVAVVGTEERRAEAISVLFSMETQGKLVDAPAPRALPEPAFVQGYDATTEAANFPRQTGLYDFVIDVGGGREDVPEGTLIYSVAELGGWETTLDRIVEDRPHLSLALARNFPVFRRRVAQRLIAETAIANAQFSLLTGVAEQIPLLGAIGLPAAALSDIFVLTKNQIMLMLRLASAYGLDVTYKSRLKELAPILVNALGWRALARELVGVVPVIGFVPRAMIAYAGTVTSGRAIQLYYETGEQVTAAHARRLYKEAYASGRDKIQALAKSLRSGKGDGGGSKRAIAAGGTANDVLIPDGSSELEHDLLTERTNLSASTEV